MQALVGYRNELALVQNMGGPQLIRGRLIGTEDASLAHNIHEGLSQQGGFEKLRVPIQRWRRSKAASNGVDLAIDLRIALESLFLDEGNNAELSFRLALRAAWYLGVEGDERAKIFDALREAYSIGSKAVHRGKGYDDMIPPELATAQDVLPHVNFAPNKRWRETTQLETRWFWEARDRNSIRHPTGIGSGRRLLPLGRVLPDFYLGLKLGFSLSRICGVGQTSPPNFQG